MSESGNSTAKAQPKWGLLSATQSWGLYPLVMGIASDFLAPLGPFAPVLFVLFVLGSAGGFYLSTRKDNPIAWAARAAQFCLIGAAVFGVILVLQAAAGKTDADGRPLGVVASTVGVVESAQSALLNTSAEPTDEFGAALRDALRAKESSDKVANARKALASEDDIFVQSAVEKLYASGDDVLRQQAIIALFESRAGGAAMPIVVIEDQANDPEIAQYFAGGGLRITRVDAASGGVRGAVHSRSFNGTIGRSGVNLTLTGAGTFVLYATDDMRLTGTYATASGVVKVAVLLN